MPTTRRSTGRTGPTKGQSTISFANRVTKAIPQDTKKAILSEPVKKTDTPQRPAKEAKAEEIVTVEPEEESEEEVVEEEVVEEVAVPEKTESELEAEKISDAQINKYWKGIEKERIAPRVHQKDLSVGEKVLRYFDVSSQYGPCIGTPRMKRWQRAQRLGLSPPIEVLAVLLKAESKNDKEAETAQMDKILNATV